MGALSELVELADKLDKSLKDRKCLDMLFPLKEKILAVQKEQFYLEKENDKLKTSHSKEVDKLKTEHAKEVADLKKVITALKMDKKPGGIVAIQDPHIADILKKI